MFPAQIRKLLAAAWSAQFGRGEETLTDPSVRETWEIAPAQVSLDRPLWEPTLAAALTDLETTLGIAGADGLRAELHSMLIYGKGQFFAPHQDSEQHEDMIATLVAVLPSPHSGGELLVSNQGMLKPYSGSAKDIELVACYADRRHEVLLAHSGTRVTLTFNVLHSPTQQMTAGPVRRATEPLREHFGCEARLPPRTAGAPGRRLPALGSDDWSIPWSSPGGRIVNGSPSS